RGDVLRTALLVVVAPDRLGAPVAAERTAARRGHVEAEVAVPFVPHRAIAFDVDQIPRGPAGQSRIRRLRAQAYQLRLSIHQGGDTGDAGCPLRGADLRIAIQPFDQVDQRCDAFADQ